MQRDALGTASCHHLFAAMLKGWCCSQPAMRGVQLWGGCAKVLLNATGICLGFSHGVGSSRCLLGLSDSSGLRKGEPNDESVVRWFVIYHEFILGLKGSCVG